MVRRSVGPSVHQSVGPSVRRQNEQMSETDLQASDSLSDLRSCVSEAKFVKESDFDVKSRLAPPKSTEIDEKHFSDIKKFFKF